MGKLLEIVAPEFEIIKMELSEEQFKYYLENGIPEDDGYDDFIEELENCFDCESGLDGSNLGDIEIYVDGQSRNNIIKNDTIYVGSTKKWKVGDNYLVRIQSGSASIELEIEDEFDESKLSFSIYPEELPNGVLISELSVSYDGNEFEYSGGSGVLYSEIFLVDKEGNVHNFSV